MYIKLYRFADTLYRIIGSVVFQVTFSERETKCPRLKEKYTNHVDLTPLKTLSESPGCVPVSRQAAAGPLPAPVSKPAPGNMAGQHSCLSDLEGQCLCEVDALVYSPLVDQNGTRN